MTVAEFSIADAPAPDRRTPSRWIVWHVGRYGWVVVIVLIGALGNAALAAAVPVLVGSLTQGLPDTLTFLGFGLALGSIWTISQNGESTDWRINFRELRLPLLAGVFFGFYFVAIHEATREAFFWPMVSARLAGTLVMLAYAAAVRGPAMPEREVWPLVILGGMLDVVGNAFYILAAKSGRLDVAAVLGSLYPGSTVILASIILKERLSPLQMLGILLALGAIVLLTV